jgi:transketolase C-terminal domain/subunit
MQIVEVKDAEQVKDFLAVNAIMNAANPCYIRALDNEVNEVFDPVKNKNFKWGQAKRWVAYTDNGELVGRIAAFHQR